MRSPPGKIGRLVVIAVALPTLLLPARPASAQDDLAVTQKAPGNEPPPFDPKTAVDSGLGMPTPYDKFVALDQALGKARVNWRQAFAKTKVDLDVDEITETRVALPVLLGFRLADGATAIKAHDAELLNRCASDIEAMAKKLGVGEAELARAKKVRADASAGEWMKVFFELGILQQDIMRTLDRAENRSRGTLVIAGGWLQGARCVSTVVRDNYTPDASNILREPMLAGALLARLQALPEPARRSPVVEKMISSLQEIGSIVDVRIDGAIPQEKVDRIRVLASEVVTTALESAKQ